MPELIRERADNGRSGEAEISREIVRIHASGCYAAQIDGTSFSRVVVMTVSTPP